MLSLNLAESRYLLFYQRDIYNRSGQITRAEIWRLGVTFGRETFRGDTMTQPCIFELQIFSWTRWCCQIGLSASDFKVIGHRSLVGLWKSPPSVVETYECSAEFQGDFRSEVENYVNITYGVQNAFETGLWQVELRTLSYFCTPTMIIMKFSISYSKWAQKSENSTYVLTFIWVNFKVRQNFHIA